MDLDTFNIGANDDGDDDGGSSLDDLLSQLSDDEDEDAEESGFHATDSAGFEWLSERLQGDPTAENPLDAAFDANHVLVLAPLRKRRTDGLCMDLCTPEPPTQLDVAFVSLTRSSEDLIEHWLEHESMLPANMALLCVGDQARSANSASMVSGHDAPTQITVTSTSDPSDLTRLGLAIVNTLSDWEDSGNQTVLCVHSLTAFLQYVDPQRLFRFFHLLQARIDRLDGFAHYHMDPNAHSQETIGIFTSLFDTIVRVKEDGSIEVDGD